MSKVIVFLLIFVSQFTFFPSQTFADTPNCSTYGISYAPNAFSVNPSDITLNFTISNKNTAENIKNKGNVRLHFISSFSAGLGDINTKSVPITVTDSGGTFTINVLDIDSSGPFSSRDALKAGGQHEAVLDWQGINSSNFDEFCNGINYYIADSDACVIDPALPEIIPPSTSLDIKFSGKPKTDYALFANTNPNSIGGRIVTTTDANGQGVFKNTEIKGNSGETVYLQVQVNVGGDVRARCYKQIKLNIAAPSPTPLPSGPIPTPGPGAGAIPSGKPFIASSGAAVCNPSNNGCTTGGGTPCGDKNNPGIATAIGCVHTNPLDFVKDLFKFLVGIGGGIAFLMMLLGAFQMVTSAGNPETLKAGQERFKDAIIGLLFVIFAVLLLQIIGIGILAIPGFTT